VSADAITMLRYSQRKRRAAPSGVNACALLPVLLRLPVPGALALAVLAALSPAATLAATYATLHVTRPRREERVWAVPKGPSLDPPNPSAGRERGTTLLVSLTPVGAPGLPIEFAER
jgi:hypothetical protein